MDQGSASAILLMLVTGIVAKPASEVTWSYDGTQDSLTPARWKDAYPLCGGENQSPVDLRLEIATPMPQNQPLKGYLIDPDFTLKNVVLQNNGRTVELLLPPRQYLIRGGGLGALYYAASLHFHWSSDSSKGSEHTKEGLSYPAEMHIIHHKIDYYDMAMASSATSDSTAIAVMGLLFKVTEENNEDLAPITDGVKVMKGRNPSASAVLTKLSSVRLGSLVRDAIQSGFFRYNGSLTVPGCNEQVSWTMFDRPLELSENQIRPFRSLVSKLGTTMLTNNRPLQSVGGRKILHSVQGWSPAA